MKYSKYMFIRNIHNQNVTSKQWTITSHERDYLVYQYVIIIIQFIIDLFLFQLFVFNVCLMIEFYWSNCYDMRLIVVSLHWISSFC